MQDRIAGRVWSRRYVLYLVLLAAAFFVAWVWLSTKRLGAVSFMDEFQFKEFSRSLTTLQMYDSAHYPLLYPLVLMPAFLFEDFYFAMKVINGLIAVATVFAAYRLARLYLSERSSLFFAAMICMMPFFVLYIPMVRAEPLFMLLMVLVAYFSLRPVNERNFYRNGFMLAFLLGCMWLTRHAAIALIPGFGLFWLYRFFVVEKQVCALRKKVVCVIMIVATILIVYSPWVLLQLKQGQTMYMILGMDITVDKGLVFSPSLLSLVKWFGLYALYLVLAVVPMLVWFFSGTVSWLKRKMQDKDRLFFGFAIMLTVFLVAIAGRYSWLRTANYPAVVRVIGRYVVYGAPFLMLGGMIQMRRIGLREEATGRGRIVISLLLACAAITLGYLVLIELKIININSSYMTGTNASALLPYYSCRWWLLAIALLGNIAGAAYMFAAGRSKGTETDGRAGARKVLRRMFAGLIALFFAVCFVSMAVQTINWPNLNKKENIVYEICQLSEGREKINLYLNLEGLSEEAAENPTIYSYGIRFYDFEVSRKIYGEGKLSGSNIIVLSGVPLEDKGEGLVLKKHLTLEDAQYYIYQRD